MRAEVSRTGVALEGCGGGVASAADGRRNAVRAGRNKHKFIRMPGGAHFCIFCGALALDDEELEMYRDTECIRFWEE